MVNAFAAGTIVAIVAGAVGWFMVLRRQSFAGHTLAVVSFPGAAGAIWLGISATAGYFAASIAAAVVIAIGAALGAGSRLQPGAAVIGTVQVFALACGFFSSALWRLPRQPHRPALRHVPRQSPTPGPHLGVVGAGVLVASPFIAPRCSSPRSTRTLRVARGSPQSCSRCCSSSSSAAPRLKSVRSPVRSWFFALLVMPPAAAQQLSARPAPASSLRSCSPPVTWLGLGAAYFSVYRSGSSSPRFGFIATCGVGVARHFQASRLTLALGRRDGLLVDH